MIQQEYDYNTVRLGTVICFMLYCAVITERVMVVCDLIITGSCDEPDWTRTVMCLGLISASLVLTCVRMYDIKDTGKLIIYRLNKLHFISDVISLLVGFHTGLGNTSLFTVYVFVAVTMIVYDTMMNVFVLWFHTFAFKMFDVNTLRLCSYTKKGYIKCLSKNQKVV